MTILIFYIEMMCTFMYIAFICIMYAENPIDNVIKERMNEIHVHVYLCF